MPTGYTAPIEDLTKPFSFEQFVWNCAGAFDYWSRDNEGTLPLEHKPDIKWDTDQIDSAKRELVELINSKKLHESVPRPSDR